MRLLLPLALGLGLTACSNSNELQVLEGSGDRDPAKIFYGDAPDQPYHDAVVSLHQLTSTSVYVGPYCTGTLIAEDVILTAAHCLDTARGGGNFKEESPGDVGIYVGDDPSADILDHLYFVSDLEIYSSYNRRSLRNDIALIQLSSAVTETTPVDALPSSLGFDSSDVGMAVNFAGFGDDETGNSGVKMQVDSTLGGLGCSVSGCGSSGDSATQVSYEQSGSTGGPCFGDSGGPMFIDRSGTTYVGGITSYGDSTCTQYGVSTRVDAFESWISTWGDSGGGDGPIDSGGDGGGEPPAGDCGDGTCGTGESCDGRGSTDICTADCDGKTNGKPSTRYCYVEGSCEGPGCP